MRELTYGWNIEMQMRAARAGLRILKIPVDYHRRRGGNSKVAGSVTRTIRAGARIIATFTRVASETSPWRHGHDRQRELSNVRIKSESSGHRHNVICFVERFRLMLDK